MTLPTDIVNDQAGHASIHNETNDQVNTNTDDIATNTATIAALTAAKGQLDTATTTNLTDIGHAVNTANKVAGKQVFNTTTKKTVTAVGNTAAAVWVDATGATTHTPA